MVSLEKIIQKIQQLDEFLGLLRKNSKTPIKLLYGEIDNAYVYEFIKKDLKDIEEFKSIIIKRYKN